MTTFLTIFRRFPPTFQRSSTIVPKARQTPPNIFQAFSNITEDCRRRPKKIRRCFDHTSTNLNVVKRTKETCYRKGMISSQCEKILVFYWCLCNKCGLSTKLRSRLLDIALLAKFSFMCLLTKTINTQKKTRPISSYLDRTSLVNRGFIMWDKEHQNMLRDTAQNPERAR